MMILTHVLLPTIITLACNDRTRGRRVFQPTNKTFDGTCVAPPRKFLQKGVVNSCCF